MQPDALDAALEKLQMDALCQGLAFRALACNIALLRAELLGKPPVPPPRSNVPDVLSYSPEVEHS